MKGMRLILALILLALLAISPPAPAPSQVAVTPSTGQTPPNIVLIISDDQGWPDFGFMQHPLVRTPNLDALAREGMTFPYGYVPSSVCRPSLAAIVSGLYPHQSGITGNLPLITARSKQATIWPEIKRDWQQEISKIRQLPSLPRLLAQHGYRSFQAGKWWEGPYQAGGFTDGMTEGDVTHDGRHGDKGLTIGRVSMQEVYRFIDRRKQDKAPFLLWYAPFLPHMPHNPPAELLAHYQDKTNSPHIAAYLAMIEWFDRGIGQLRQHIEQQGLADNTVFVFVSDNGWEQNPNTEGSTKRSKRSPFDLGLRSPIILHWPGHIEAGMQQQPVSAIDLAPTLLQLVGVTSKQPLPGHNLLDPKERAEHGPVFGEVYRPTQLIGQKTTPQLRWRWLVSPERHKLMVSHNQNAPSIRLYDLNLDPYERHNLAIQRPHEVARLLHQLNRWWFPLKQTSAP